MTNHVTYDPAMLFRFALRQNDWVLADLLAHALRRDQHATRRLARELASQSKRRAVPTSFAALRVLARLSRELGVDNGTPT